ncbi:MAG: YaiO family outer membrane beta-barrel protein [Candidatus Marinimicrobia bacterium]|nr:YaiO family outer membrane beta-barrel protein [Candidatus Neomarinimicrobiota bacterium]MCF7829729.1 YaiO family outer membrane beta-barrel protein [Candidatus Neomarinimicrobiota bacterium]MCF7881679.1 YaiO family outer membrane beta-barrel protein [Candidatus Neomarinimicrobiota bacterium]
MKLTRGLLFWVGIIILTTSNPVYGQDVNVDSLFAEARDAAFEQENRELARQLSMRALEISPAYHEIRIFLGRLYAWDSQYEQAEKQLQRVLAADPGNTDARGALLDVYIWSEQYTEVLETARSGLRRNPVNEKFLYSKSLALSKTGEPRQAIITLNTLLQVEPSHERGLTLFKLLQEQQALYEVSLSYRYDRFQSADGPWNLICTDQNRDPWHTVNAEINRRFGFGPAIFRVHQASRFGQNDWQAEFDLYPSIRQGTYAYLNVGFAGADLFPEYRFGGELYQSLPKAFEVSLGLRYMKFTASDVAVYTMSAGKYWGNYWLNFRTYLTPKAVSFSRSAIFTARRYFRDAENYIGLTFSLGESPDLLLSAGEANNLSARAIQINGHWKMGAMYALKWNVSFANEEWQTEQYLKNCGIELGLSRQF